MLRSGSPDAHAGRAAPMQCKAQVQQGEGLLVPGVAPSCSQLHACHNCHAVPLPAASVARLTCRGCVRPMAAACCAAAAPLRRCVRRMR